MADIADWPRHYLCYWCMRDGRGRVAATVRVLSGIGGGGWPACAEHAKNAETAGLRPLVENKQLVANYTVDAFEVVTDSEGFPVMGRRLWTASRRLAP